MTNTFDKSENFKSEYCCSVVRIGELIPIEGADKIAQTIINGDSIVVRKDQVKEGDILFYSSNETQLNEGFLSANNLFEVGCWEKNANAEEVKGIVADCNMLKTSIDATKKMLSTADKAIRRHQIKILSDFVKKYCSDKITNSDTLIYEANKYYNIESDKLKKTQAELEEKRAELKKYCGFFNKYGRVKLIRLKGIPSVGYIFSIDELKKWKDVGDVDLESMVGEDFDTIDGELFVKAYVPPVKEVHNSNGQGKSDKNNRKLVKKFDRLIEGEFKFHYDTDPLAKNMHLLNPETVVTVSDKIHGCVEENTIVKTMEFGEKTIGEIVNGKIECHILARDLINETDIYVPIDDFYRVDNDGDWYKIEMEDGTEIIITGNNPVWCPELGLYRRVDELDGDEKLLVFTEKKLKIKKITKLPIKYNRYDLTVSSTNNFYANGILIHNTSTIIGNVKVKNKINLPIYKKAWNLITDNRFLSKYKIQDWYEDYGPVYSSRKVIKNEYLNPKVTEGYYGVDIWTEYGELMYPYIEKGMTIYGEIFGYLSGSDKMIQKDYDYGCQVGTNKLMVYRISTKNEEGNVKEWDVEDVYNWTVNLIKEHPELEGRLEPITILYHGKMGDMYPDIDTKTHWHENVLEAMKNDTIRLGMELLEPFCINSVPREGIVLRMDGDPINEAFKLKSMAFLFRESKEMDEGNADIEMNETNY